MTEQPLGMYVPQKIGSLKGMLVNIGSNLT